MLRKIREATQDDRGFTLIELMVVVLIIAILIAIAIPTFLGLRERAQNRSAQSDVRNGLTAAKAFYTDNETFVGFTVTVAEGIEPSLDFNATGNKTQVGIRVATVSDVMLTKQSDSNDWFCARDQGGLSSVRGPGATEPANMTACNNLPGI
ncbi:MAG: prepilin-type N-terminal cleavage/methylation domain-containing protein [Actinomycetota bacterium]